MPTDDDIFRIVHYGYWDTAKLHTYQTVSGVNVGTQAWPEANVVVFPGTENLLDTIRDFDFAIIQVSGVNGGIHRGFHTGLPDVLTVLLAVLPLSAPVIVCGHSLGAARACIFGKMLESVGYSVIYRIFGCPYPGDQHFAQNFTGSDIKSWRNNADRICDLPPLPDREQVAPFIPLACPSFPDDLWLEFRDHHFQLYEAAKFLVS